MALATSVSPSLAVALGLVLAGCEPLVMLELDGASTTSGAPDEETSPPDESTTADEDPSTTSAPDMPPDVGEPEPSLCPAGAGDLALEWTVDEPAAHQADAVAAGAGIVAWTSGQSGDTRLQVLEADGTPRWEQSLPLLGGQGAQPLEDLEIAPDGNVLLAATTYDDDDFDGLFRWYDDNGGLIAEDVYTTPAHDTWEGIARLSDGDVVLVGETDGTILVRRMAPGGAVEWSETFSEASMTWASHVAVAPGDLIFVSGYAESNPSPALLAYDGDGMLLWSHIVDNEEFGYATSVAADALGRAWLAIDDYLGTARVERYDAAGTLDLTVTLDYFPQAIATDVDGSIVVSGSIPAESLIVVERYTANGSHVARYERSGRFTMGVAVDEECHAYVVGFDDGPGAWLDKLR